MPPKKRKAAAAAAATAPAGKKVRIGDESVIEEDNTPATGRLRRSTSNDNPRYNFTNTRGGSKATTAGGRGGAKVGAGRGGRGGGSRGGAKTVAAAAAAATTAVAPNTKTVTGRGRGRPKKTVEPEPEPEPEDQVGGGGEDEVEDEVGPVKKETKAGRKGILKKNNNAAAATAKAEAAVNGASVPAKRGRGRPPAGTDAKPAVDKKPGAGTNAKSAVEKQKPGRPAKKPKLEEDGLTDEEALNKGAAALLHESVDPEIQYWLMKAEPESRMEKGVDVKFSIDDLAAKTEPEGWDGVRNPVARNNMRSMRVNDLAFFYHSNCKKPAVVGVMRVVEEHSVDESAFDPDHPYYDPKSDRAKPKWELVKVEFVKKFETEIGLKELRKYAENGGVLANMQMLKQSRLSVSGVNPDEWRFILELAGEPISLGQPSRSGGYEGDTDGEAEAHEADDGKLPASSFEVPAEMKAANAVDAYSTSTEDEDEEAGPAA